MAKTITLNLLVNDGDVEVLVGKLQDAGFAIDNVEGKAQKLPSEFKKSAPAIRALDNLTRGWASGVADVATGLKSVVTGLNLTKAALVATGVGALVVALGVIIAYWEDIVELIQGANEELQNQIDLSNRIIDNLEVELAILETREKIFIREGKTTEEIRIQRERVIQLLRIENDILIKNLENQLNFEESKARELTTWDNIVDNVRSLFGFSETKLIDDEEIARIKEVRDQLNAAKLAREQLKLDFLEVTPEVKPTTPKKRDRVEKINPITGEDVDKERERISKHFEELFDLDQTNKDALQESSDAALERLLTSEELAEAKRTLIAEEGAKSRERIAELEAQAKVESFMIAANGFAAASDLIGRETAAGKAFAVASTLVSTWLSAQLAFQSQLKIATPDAPIRAAAAAAVAVAAGLANVKQILSVKVPGQGGGSFAGGSPSTPPAFNVVQNSPQNQLNQSLLEQQGQPVEAFVVDKNVTSAQELRRNKVSASSLG
jgi:hypothetical protein